jgi:hypothetical protein
LTTEDTQSVKVSLREVDDAQAERFHILEDLVELLQVFCLLRDLREVDSVILHLLDQH